MAEDAGTMARFATTMQLGVANVRRSRQQATTPRRIISANLSRSRCASANDLGDEFITPRPRGTGEALARAADVPRQEAIAAQDTAHDRAAPQVAGAHLGEYLGEYISANILRRST